MKYICRTKSANRSHKFRRFNHNSNADQNEPTNDIFLSSAIVGVSVLFVIGSSNIQLNQTKSDGFTRSCDWREASIREAMEEAKRDNLLKSKLDKDIDIIRNIYRTQSDAQIHAHILDYLNKNEALIKKDSGLATSSYLGKLIVFIYTKSIHQYEDYVTFNLGTDVSKELNTSSEKVIVELIKGHHEQFIHICYSCKVSFDLMKFYKLKDTLMESYHNQQTKNTAIELMSDKQLVEHTRDLKYIRMTGLFNRVHWYFGYKNGVLIVKRRGGSPFL